MREGLVRWMWNLCWIEIKLRPQGWNVRGRGRDGDSSVLESVLEGTL